MPRGMQTKEGDANTNQEGKIKHKEREREGVCECGEWKTSINTRHIHACGVAHRTLFAARRTAATNTSLEHILVRANGQASEQQPQPQRDDAIPLFIDREEVRC